jgi:uncharacterized protein (DUF983 family)
VTVRSTTGLLWRGLLKRCANCGQKRLFRGWFTMVEHCPGCGLTFERVEGQWIGAIAMNMIFTEALIGAIGLAMTVALWPDPPWLLIAILTGSAAVAFPLFFYPFSKTVWVAIDLRMRPIEERERLDAMARHPDLRPGTPSVDPSQPPVEHPER